MPSGKKSEGDGSSLVNGAGLAACRDESFVALPILDERIQLQIGHKLSLYYSMLVDQPIPDKFIKLLAQLDKTEIVD